ncbi:ribosome hibernation-promoting factor, HPF/YfiA family [Nitratidesulfovibrio sp. 1201_IL3209]|uniref:ribosome hibernation-promoting factor, HPF/YfiA family n=1 Tax=Nitratidesulfovibrio sp. 1201_IL3209 TaxID=3084053 RepID=UPI002FD96E18
MNIAFTFKNFEPSDHLKKYARRRLEKLGRFVGKSALDMQVNLSVDKFRHKAEVQMAGDGFTLSAMEQSEDMYATLDLVLEKLESQLRKQVEKLKDRRRSVQSERVGKGIDVFTFSTMGEGEDRTIVGTDHFAPKPMHVDEAAMQLDQGDNEFLVFLNAEVERVNIIYRRRNGDFGLIDPVV